MTGAEELALLEALGEAGAGGNTLLEQVRALIADRDRLAAQLQERSRRRPREAMLASLDERREGVLLLLADACLDEADWLGDRGGQGDRGEAARLRLEAKGWGWLGLHRKWPTQTRGGDWLWDLLAEADSDLFSDQLAMPAQLPSHQRFPSCRAALRWVVGLIARGEWKPG